MSLRFSLFAIVGCGLALGTAQADTPPTAQQWQATQTLHAPEANQAAAADERFVYAVTNNQVAKYDRQTGKRLAVSTGAAKHLNSAFLWQGRLYCAHSNYPRQPEISEIMALDPTTMQLTTFKEFGQLGGSLTWAVYHDGHWWCNFACYGAENDRSFLVKFDPQWREKGRWAYPPALVRALGRYSLSGGVWYKDSLLATGHNDPVVLELRIPKQGNVLEFVGVQTVPFFGQGFAIDPKTEGLVGICRKTHEIVFAERRK